MAEIVPVLPNLNLVVRTYPNDYAETNTESEGEAQFQDSAAEEDDDISARLKQNQDYLDLQITSSLNQDYLDLKITSSLGERWLLETQTWKTSDGTDVVLVRKPTASNLPHRVLNPYIYRNIKNVGPLDELARLLDTPSDWETKYNQVVQDGYIIDQMNDFRNLSVNTLEADIQCQFGGLVSAIARSLDLRIRPSSETKVIVGGILARYQYDVRSKTDPHFLNINGLHLIASEVKTHRTFAPGEMWYHGSRGIQVLSALYAFNCPTFLFTQRQWKLFVENTARNAILTFPYDDNPDHTPHVNSSLVQQMGTTFLKAIVICLLSRRVSLHESMKSITLQESSRVKDTPRKTIIKPKYFDTPEKPVRMSSRLLGQPKPSYVSGYDAKGQPIYSLVRVVPQEVVTRIEDEIAVQEKNGHQKPTSEMTLCE
jgi:hypothetical protein